MCLDMRVGRSGTLMEDRRGVTKLMEGWSVWVELKCGCKRNRRP